MKRTHLVWDWNGTLLNDFELVLRATNHALATVGGPAVTADHHRRHFIRPVADYYAMVLGRAVDADEFDRLDEIFHDAYRAGLTTCALADDAVNAMRSWGGSQSLLSMWFHEDLVPAVTAFGLDGRFQRVDGVQVALGGDRAFKAGHLARHIDALEVDGGSVVLIGDSLDDADAATSVGAGCVLYTGGFTDEARLRASGHPVAGSLSEAVALALTA
ncbi:Phosphoglycolate phosphatase, HAD superfamily [Asanoa hainanensis]|uniref:Phosphoglycolate phosphatase, HAD superfamily n=1 Tax=Asanoa hainanensis TaxID=560556 RepID=A0A239P2Y7_9ACTN|nr:HAD hydrolase-like protein [Asanoa hainanensis]SNT61497.1 Phosphoglycolate phosphatase, HAD superfamily [Asanoa hainanensis]